MHVSFRTQRGIAHPTRQIPRRARDDKRTRTTYDRLKSTPMRHPKPNALSWLVLSAIVIALDKWTKAWVLSSLPEYTPVPVIDGLWILYRTYNPGLASSSDRSGGKEVVVTMRCCGWKDQ